MYQTYMPPMPHNINKYTYIHTYIYIYYIYVYVYISLYTIHTMLGYIYIYIYMLPGSGCPSHIHILIYVSRETKSRLLVLLPPKSLVHAPICSSTFLLPDLGQHWHPDMHVMWAVHKPNVISAWYDLSLIRPCGFYWQLYTLSEGLFPWSIAPTWH